MVPFGFPLVKTAASFAAFCLGMMGRSVKAVSSAKEFVGDDAAGLGGSRCLEGPDGAGLRRDATDSMAVNGEWASVLELEMGNAASRGFFWLGVYSGMLPNGENMPGKLRQAALAGYRLDGGQEGRSTTL